MKEHYLLLIFFNGARGPALHEHSYDSELMALQQAKYHAGCGHVVDVYHVTGHNNNVHPRYRVKPAEIIVERL